MTYIQQPKEEGQSMNCPNCGDLIVGRLKEYNDFPSKIQWQDKGQTKAHYDKNGNCKGAEGTKSTLEFTTPTREDIPSKANSIDEDMRYVKNKIDLLFAMVSEQFRDYTDRKNHS